MAQAGTQLQEEGSMEDILQSIRRIIADEQDDPNAESEMQKETLNTAEESDILELTEIVEDTPAEATSAEAESDSVDDVLKQIDNALSTEEASLDSEDDKKEEPTNEVQQDTSTKETIEEAPLENEKLPTAETPANEGDSLISNEALSASREALDKLNVPQEPTAVPLHTSSAPNFVSGMTIEDLVHASLKPMLKEWLDANLPTIVERIVEREIHRIRNDS